MTPEDQPGFDPRLSWAAEGAVVLAQVCPVLVVVDVLRFSTAVEVAVGLRNASAVAAAARDLGGPVAVVAAVAASLDAAADLRLAAEHDVSRVVPRLAGGGFAQLS